MSILSKVATENYLKCIVKNLSIPGKVYISTGELAESMNVTPGTATTMMKRLEKYGYLNYKSHYGSTLTEKGEAVGVAVLRRHRLIETFLEQVLGMNKEEVHFEAEQIEHAVSDKLIDKIDEFLRFPKTDPHGEVIPTKQQTIYRIKGTALINAPKNKELKVESFAKTPELMQYFDEIGLTHNTIILINSISMEIGQASATIDNKKIVLPIGILDKIIVSIVQ